MIKCKIPIIESLANIANKTTHTFFCLPIPPLRVNSSLRFGEFLCYVFSPEEKLLQVREMWPLAPIPLPAAHTIRRIDISGRSGIF